MSKFKAEIALEAIKDDKTISQIASEYGIHPQQVRIWKKEFLENMHLVFKKEDQTKELKAVSRICCKKALYPIISCFSPCQDIFFLSAIPCLCLSISPPQVLSTIVHSGMLLLLCYVFSVLCSPSPNIRCPYPSSMFFRKRLVVVRILKSSLIPAIIKSAFVLYLPAFSSLTL